MHARMGHREPRLLKDRVAIQKQVQVNRARSHALRRIANPPEDPLDPQQLAQKLRLRLKQEDGSAQELVVLPTDVATRNQAEWLSFRKEDGQTDEVRLDQILSADPMGNR